MLHWSWHKNLFIFFFTQSLFHRRISKNTCSFWLFLRYHILWNFIERNCRIFLEINFVKFSFSRNKLWSFLNDLCRIEIFNWIHQKIWVLFINVLQPWSFLIGISSCCPQTFSYPAKITRFIQILCIWKLLAWHRVLQNKVIKQNFVLNFNLFSFQILLFCLIFASVTSLSLLLRVFDVKSWYHLGIRSRNWNVVIQTAVVLNVVFTTVLFYWNFHFFTARNALRCLFARRSDGDAWLCWSVGLEIGRWIKVPGAEDALALSRMSMTSSCDNFWSLCIWGTSSSYTLSIIYAVNGLQISW